MRTDIFLGVITVVMAFLGFVISLSPPQRYKKIYAVGFGLLGISAVALVVLESNETTKDKSILAHNLSDLQNSSKELLRVQGLNTELQSRLLAQSRTIADLSLKGIDTATGGDSFAYLRFTTSASEELSPDAKRGFVTIKQQGRYPLYELSARMTDMNTWKPPVPGQIVPPGLDSGLGLPLNVGTLATGLSWSHFGSPIDFGDRTELSFVVQFYARNGAWFEVLRLSRRSGKWTQDIQVVWPEQKRKPFNLVR